MSQKPFYISTSIAYVNGSPHVGFAMESIEADVLARWARKNGRETFFCTGTDEHGEKIQKTADSLGTTPQEICDKNAAEFQRLGHILNLSNDFFIRTSDKKIHWGSVQKLWRKMVEAGDIEKRNYTAQYCYGCEAFLTEKDLDENGNCPHHLRPPEEISEENYFFKLSKYSKKIAELIETKELEIIPHFRANEILQVAKSGFFDVSFSRPSKKLPWGIPVPNDDSQNMYVWCDALTNYISALGYAEFESNGEKSFSSTEVGKNFQKFWNKGETVHVVGKDIVRFHAGIWIGMLLSAGLKIPDKIVVHGFLTSEGHKMSKSLGNVVDPFLEVEKYGVDALRYFLIREVPLGNDADFSRKRFEEIYQAHLANGLGNLVSRVANLWKKSDSSNIARVKNPSSLQQYSQNFHEKMEKFLLHEALAEILKVVDFCDGQITGKKPWESLELEETQNFLAEMVACVEWIGEYISPFLPETAEKIQKCFSVQNIGIPMLFPRLEKLNLPNVDTHCNVLLEAPQLPTINFTINSQTKTDVKFVFLSNVAVKKTPKGLQKFCKKIAEEFLENGGKQNKNWKNRIDAQYAVIESQGFSKEVFKNAPDILGSLVEKNGKLPNFSNIVDLYNIISLKHGLSAGAHDCAFLSPNIKIDFISGQEIFEEMKGKEYLSVENVPLKKGEWAFFLSENEIGCRFDSAQCEKSKILEGNRNIFVYFHAPKGNEEWAILAMEEFLEKGKEFGLI